MSDWKNILPSTGSITEEQLMQYLAGNASEELRFEIEKQMSESPFLDDAVEGLQQYKNPAAISALQLQLRQQLKQTLNPKAKRNKRRIFKDQYWLIYAVFGVLILCVIGYLIIHFYGRK
ncbi:MAG: hypothetical protein K2X37_11165 [Chitinophagaceae bacterium]|nr:hypothetical protein [Chitinophagaceae bacterium]